MGIQKLVAVGLEILVGRITHAKVIEALQKDVYVPVRHALLDFAQPGSIYEGDVPLEHSIIMVTGLNAWIATGIQRLTERQLRFIGNSSTRIFSLDLCMTSCTRGLGTSVHIRRIMQDDII